MRTGASARTFTGSAMYANGIELTAYISFSPSLSRSKAFMTITSSSASGRGSAGSMRNAP